MPSHFVLPAPPAAVPVALRERLADPATPLVACLCAAWCRTCDAYAPIFAALAAAHPEACFVWIDVETHADLLDEVDVVNFPTVLIAHRGATQFFGPVLPHREVLARLLAEAQASPGDTVSGDAPDLRASLLGA